jgi:hypothetical protein
VFKSWLQTQRPNTTDWVGLANQAWPNQGADNSAETASLKRGNGNGGVASKVNSNDGSIGYVELADARNNGFTKTPNAAATDAIDKSLGGDDTFWIRVENGSSALGDPTGDPLSYKKGFEPAARGANCKSVTFTDDPANNPAGTLPAAPGNGTDRTLANWDKVSAVNSSAGYGICTLSYVLAFDDNALAYNSSNGFNDPVAEEKRARTVKDYLTTVLSQLGQDAAFAQDYDQLPANILTIARGGVAALDWCKAGGGCGAGVKNPPPPPPPNNKFSIPSYGSSSTTGSVFLSVKIPGKGTVQGVARTTYNKVTGKGKKRKVTKTTITYGSITQVFPAGGTYNLAIKPTKAGKQARASVKSLTVKLTVTFTPSGGKSRLASRTLTVKGLKKG